MVDDVPRRAILRSESSVWLLPHPIQGHLLSAAILAFANELSTPVFPPHLTVAGPGRVDSRTVHRVLSRAAALGPLRLQASGWGHSRHRFRALYVRLVPSEQLRHLQSLFLSIGYAPSGRPHLSLLYAYLPDRRAASLARHIRISQSYVFDRVAVATPSAGAWDDVSSWGLAVTRPLRGQSAPLRTP